MLIPPDASIAADEATIDELLLRLRSAGVPGWRYDPGEPVGNSIGPFRGKRSNGSGAALSLRRDRLSEGLGVLRVTNILPDVGQIPAGEYGKLAASFVEAVRGTFRDLELTERVSPVDRGVDDYLAGSDLRSALDSFTVNANKQCMHPFDVERWFVFLIGFHQTGKRLPWDLLREHLIAAGFDDDKAAELAAEFELSKRLLAAYDGSLKPRQ